jgi:hypothetical protein
VQPVMNYFTFFFIFLGILGSCENNTADKNTFVSEQKEKTNENQVNDKILIDETDENHELVDTLINSEKYVVIANKNAKVKIIQRIDSSKYKDFKVMYFKDQMLVVAKDINEDTFKIYEKYTPNSTFEDFKVRVATGELMKPDFEKYPWAKNFKTRITTECENGINFAGKYTLVIWGCGSPCQSGAIIDRTNGKIYDAYASAYGSEFRKDSNLIIINSALIDEETKLIELQNVAEVRTEIWDGAKFNPL